MQKSQNTFVASVRVRMTDLVGINDFLAAQGMHLTSKSHALSMGIKFMAEHIPDEFKCHSNRQAYERFIKLGYSSGFEKDNRLSVQFKNAVLSEADAEKTQADMMPEIQRIMKDMECKRVNEDPLDVPGDRVNIREEMMKGLVNEKTKDE